MSFDHIREKKPSTAGLLSLMSFFDQQGIPENLIRRQYTANYKLILDLINDTSSGETSKSDIGPDFEDNITILRDYSFISISEDSTLFTIHRLVQLTTRTWLKSYRKINHWREKYISNLY